MMPNNEAVYEAQGKTMEKVNVLPEERTTALLSDWPTIHDLSVAMRADSERVTGSRRIRLVIA